MTKTQMARLVTVVIVCVPLTACSVASFRKPVDDFAQATRDTTEALRSLDKQVTDGYADLIRKRVAAGKFQARIKKDDCGVESNRCQIVVGDAEDPLSPDSAMRNMLDLMDSIQRYADGLAEIVNANTAAEVTTQVNATVGSLNNVATTVAKLNRKDTTSAVNLTDYATPVGDLVSWLVGRYVAKVQLDGLRRATVDARPVISDAAEMFALAANESSRGPRALMAEEVSKQMDVLRKEENERNISERTISAVTESATRYDGLLLGNSPAVFMQFKQSHEALVAKIQDEKVTLVEALSQIEAFAAEARKFADLVKKIEAAGEKKVES